MNRTTPIILAVALFMENMDATVIATSLPAIAADIDTSPVALKLALTSYLVALAIFIPVSGWVADRFGAKNVFRWAIVVFMLGSVACAFANSLESFVVARFFQGVGGSMMTPLARLILFRSTKRGDLVSAMAWLTIPALVGPLLGPPVGGFLTTYFGWQWIFFINIPIGLMGIAAVTRFLPAIDPLPPRPLDWRGFLLLGTAFAGIVFGLSVISLPALPPIYGALTVIVGIAAGLGYVFHARRADQPLLNLNLFRHPTFRAAISSASIFLLGVGAIPFLLPLTLQLAFGLTPFQSGLVTFVAAGGALTAKFFARPVYAAAGFRSALLLTAVLSSTGIAIKGLFNPAWPIVAMMGVILLGGIVRSTFFTGTNALSLAEVTSDEAGQATAILSVIRPVSQALAVALAGSILEIAALVSGEELTLVDFQTAFFVVAAVSALAVVPILRLASDAGADVSGHRAAGDPEINPTPK